MLTVNRGFPEFLFWNTELKTIFLEKTFYTGKTIIKAFIPKLLLFVITPIKSYESTSNGLESKHTLCFFFILYQSFLNFYAENYAKNLPILEKIEDKSSKATGCGFEAQYKWYFYNSYGIVDRREGFRSHRFFHDTFFIKTTESTGNGFESQHKLCFLIFYTEKDAKIHFLFKHQNQLRPLGNWVIRAALTLTILDLFVFTQLFLLVTKQKHPMVLCAYLSLSYFEVIFYQNEVNKNEILNFDLHLTLWWGVSKMLSWWNYIELALW